MEISDKVEDIDQNAPIPTSEEQGNFIRELLKMYKENRLLWDQSHPNYKNRTARYFALECMQKLCKEYVPDADIDYVRNKIATIKGAFRREYRKVMNAKEKGETYIPSLWYYNLLSFTVGEDGNYTDDAAAENRVICFWSKEHTLILIELFKKYPELYCSNPPDSTQEKRKQALEELTNKLSKQTGNKFKVRDVQKKLSVLKGQFRKEILNRSNKENPSATFWCFDMLTFLMDDAQKEKIKEDKDCSEDDNLEEMDMGEHKFMDTSDTKLLDSSGKKFLDEDCDDIFDTIAKNVAKKLRDMEDDQRQFADNLVNIIMYHGLMGNLTSETKLNIE